MKWNPLSANVRRKNVVSPKENAVNN